MKNLLGKFQTMEYSSWKGLTRDNHLSAIFRTEPQKASDFMIQLMAANEGNTLESMLSNFPTKTFDTDDEYTWDVVGDTRENIPLIEARDEFGNVVGADSGNIGANTAPFYLVFPKDWFADGEIIEGNLGYLYPMRVRGEARMEGTNAVYQVECWGGNIDGIPAERLQYGELFSVQAAYVEAEMSREVGDVRFATPIAMRNEFSHIRIKHKVPGNKLNKKLAIGVPIYANNKLTTTNMWMHDVDYAVESQFRDYKNNALAYGRSTRNPNGEYTNIGKSGGVIKSGDGLYAQMDVANVITYNKFSLKLVTDAIYSITHGKKDIKDRVILMRTGEMGAIQFSEEVKKEVSGWNILKNDEVGAIKRTSSNLHQNALSAGFQFVEYLAPNGVVLRVEVDPSYDDAYLHKLNHPKGGPVWSYRYDIMDMGTSKQPNIFKCAVKNEPEYRGYQWGPFRNPFTGETNNPYASFDEDAAVIHKYATIGICVLDPTRTVSIIPAI